MSDKGFGQFGSHEWHANQIADLSDSDAICHYVHSLLGKPMDPESTVDKTKQKAIEAIRVH